MTEKVMYWTSVVLSGLALLLFVIDTGLISGNRSLQEEINQRQALIDSSARLTPLNQNLAQALAEASIKNNDSDIRDLLAAQGIKINKNDNKKTETPARKKPTSEE